MTSEDPAEKAPADTPPNNVVSARAVLKILAVILAVMAALWLLYRLGRILLLLILSIFFSYLIAPLVTRLERPVMVKERTLKLPRAAAIGIAYLAIAGLIGLLIYGLLPTLTQQSSALVSRLPEYAGKASKFDEWLDHFYKTYQIPPAWQQAISSALGRFGGNLFQWIGQHLPALLAVVTFLPWLALVPIFAFFMLKDAEVFRATIVCALPTRQLRRRIDELFTDVNEALAAYIRAQLLACLVVGTIASLGFKLLGAPYPIVLGVIAGTLEFIPLAGPLVAAVIAISVSMTVAFKVALSVLIFLLVLRGVEDYVIYPHLVGHRLELHPLAIIVAVLAGAELGGVVGIFLAIPALALITICYKHWMEYRGGKGLVADLLQPPTERPPLKQKHIL